MRLAAGEPVKFFRNDARHLEIGRRGDFDGFAFIRTDKFVVGIGVVVYIRIKIFQILPHEEREVFARSLFRRKAAFFGERFRNNNLAPSAVFEHTARGKQLCALLFQISLRRVGNDLAAAPVYVHHIETFFYADLRRIAETAVIVGYVIPPASEFHAEIVDAIGLPVNDVFYRAFALYRRHFLVAEIRRLVPSFTAAFFERPHFKTRQRFYGVHFRSHADIERKREKHDGNEHDERERNAPHGVPRGFSAVLYTDFSQP